MVGITNYKNFDSYLASRLYRVLPDESENANSDPDNDKLDRFNCCNGIRESVIDCWPRSLGCCKCCRRHQRKERAMHKARDLLLKEINIIQMIKMTRYFELALKLLIPENKIAKLQEQAKFIIVDPEEKETD